MDDLQGACRAVIRRSPISALLGRVDKDDREEQAGLTAAIWHDANVIRISRSGTGAGPSARSHHRYQTAEPGYTIGPAHNHYLQLAAGRGLVTSPTCWRRSAYCYYSGGVWRKTRAT